MKKILSITLAMLMLLSVFMAAPLSAGAADAHKISVYFENNWLWSDVFVHTWGSSVVADTGWGAGEVELVGTSVNGNEVYKATIGSDATGVIFAGTKDDGSGNTDQTPDIKSGFYDGACYSMTWDDGNAVVLKDIADVCPELVQPETTEAPTEAPTESPEVPDPEPAETYTLYFVDYADNFEEVYAYAGNSTGATGDEITEENAEWPGVKMEPTGEVLSENAEQAGGLVYSVTFDKAYELIIFSGNYGVGEEVESQTATLTFEAGKYCYWGNESWYDSLAELEAEHPYRDPSDEPEDEIEYMAIYFQNNWLWTDVKVHFWGSASVADTEWPGMSMDYYDNDGNYDIYIALVPTDVTGFVINGIKDDGSGQIDKTPNIEEGFYDGICYYMMWDNGNMAGSEDITVILPDDGSGDVEEEVSGTSLEGLSVTLGGKIGLNLHYKITEDIMADESAKLIVYRNNDPWYELPVTEFDRYDEETGYYIYTVDLVAKEMADSVVSKVVTDDYNTFFNRVSLAGYCERILSDPVTYANEQDIVKAMLNYGAASQLYFGYGTDFLANNTDYMTEEEKTITAQDLSEFAPVVEGTNDGNVQFYGATLTLKSETTLKLYFKADNVEDNGDVGVQVEGLTAYLTPNGNLYELVVPDIYAHNLGNAITVATDCVTVEYSPMSYAYVAQQSEKAELVDLANAIAAYYTASCNYNG